jgi:hypothetical protein
MTRRTIWHSMEVQFGRETIAVTEEPSHGTFPPVKIKQTKGVFGCSPIRIMNARTCTIRITTAFVASLTLVLFGCTAIRSTRHTGYDTGSGLAYYLPKGTLKLLIIREVVTSVSDVTPAPGGKAVKPLTTNSFVSVDVELAPDRSARYLLAMKPKWIADDYMKFKVTNGLLETVTVTNSDQTIGVFNNLVLAAVEFYKFATLGGFTAAGAGELLITNRTTNIFLIDPFNKIERSKLTDKVQKDHAVTLDFSDFTGSVENSILICTNATNTQGVFYRPLERYQFKWSSSGGAGAGSLYFPNAAPILSMDVKRAAFVSQSYVLSLQQGVPVEVTLNKPSQALALSAFPLTVARSLVSLPTNLIQLRIDYSSRQTELIKAKDAQITNLIHLLETQRRFESFQATNSTATNSQTKAGRGS